jgi:hypothetical protein
MAVGGGDDLGSEAQNLDLDSSSVRPDRRFPFVVELEDLDLLAVDRLQIGWLGGELDQPVTVDSLCDEFGCGADGLLWVEAMAEDETRRELFEPRPL